MMPKAHANGANYNGFLSAISNAIVSPIEKYWRTKLHLREFRAEPTEARVLLSMMILEMCGATQWCDRSAMDRKEVGMSN
jgi:hypothetical protein